MNCVAKLPNVTMTSGLIVCVCWRKKVAHASISSGFGLRFEGGLHLRTFAMKTSSRLSPATSSSSSRNFPAAPTKGFPCKSSFLPGASPIIITRACGLPSPKTTLVLPSQSEHALQVETSSRISANGLTGTFILPQSLNVYPTQYPHKLRIVQVRYLSELYT